MSQSTTQLTPHLWVAQSEFYFTNSGVFLDGRQAYLVDPGLTPEEISAIARFVSEQGAAVQALVLTHGHWDHILGPERFPGVKTIAQENYLAEVSGKYDIHLRRQVADWEAGQDLERAQPFVVPHPRETFESEKSLQVGNISLRLIHAPGHAAEQLVIYQPDNGTLWAADMLGDLEIPYVSHSLAAYERTLEMLSALELQALVPGHGHTSLDPAEIRSRIATDSAYLAELRDRVERAVRAGKTAEETVDLCTDMRFHHPQENERPHLLNIESVYLELGGEPPAHQIGWESSVPPGTEVLGS